VRALVFWERFFILYFRQAALTPRVLPKLRVDELTAHFTAASKQFPNNLRARMLYECFTTWSADIIPRAGAFLTPPPPSGPLRTDAEQLVGVITSAHPSPLVYTKEAAAAAAASILGVQPTRPLDAPVLPAADPVGKDTPPSSLSVQPATPVEATAPPREQPSSEQPSIVQLGWDTDAQLAERKRARAALVQLSDLPIVQPPEPLTARAAPGPASAALARLSRHPRAKSSEGQVAHMAIVVADAGGLADPAPEDTADVPRTRQLLFGGKEAWEHLDSEASLELLGELLPKRVPPPSPSDYGEVLAASAAALQAKLAILQKQLVGRVRRQVAAGGSSAVVEPPTKDPFPTLMLEGDGGNGGDGDGGSGSEAEAAAAPFWAEVRADAEEHRDALLSLKLADLEYLELVRKLNVNQRSKETESVTVRHPECEQPVMFVLPQIKIAPGPPEVSERLQANRAAFVALHASLSELAVRYAHTVELLLALAHSMHLEALVTMPVPEGSRAAPAVLAYPNAPAADPSVVRAGAVEFFFLMLEVGVGYSMPPTVEPLGAFVSSTLAAIGAAYLANVADMQRRLLVALLAARSERPRVPMPAQQLRQLDELAREKAERVEAERLAAEARAAEGARLAEVEMIKAKARAEAEAAALRGDPLVIPLPVGPLVTRAEKMDTSGRLNVGLLEGPADSATLSNASPSQYQPPPLPPPRPPTPEPELAEDASEAATSRGNGYRRGKAIQLPVQLPEGVVPNQQYSAKLDDGSKVVFTAPPNARAGQMIELEVPAGRKATRAVVATDEGATGLSRLVDPEARREAEKGLLDRLPLDWIGRVFTPNALLDAAPPRLLEFGQLLNLIAEAPVDRLDPADVPTLLRALNVSRYLDAVSMPTAAMSREEREALREGEELTLLALTTERLLCSRPLAHLGVTFLHRIAQSSFPVNVQLALQIVLTAAVSNSGLPSTWHSLFEALPFDRLSVRGAALLVHTLNEALPLPPCYMDSAATFLRWVLLSSPQLPADLAAEMAAGDDLLYHDGANSLWQELTAFFGSLLTQATQGVLTVSTCVGSLRLLFELVGASRTPELINQGWYFVTEVLSPAAAVVGDSSELVRASHDAAQMLPWRQLTCHLYDESFVDGLLALTKILPTTALVIFSKLDWVAWVTNLIAAKSTAPVGGHAHLAALLRLVLEINLSAPQWISTPTRIVLLGARAGGESASAMNVAAEAQLRSLHDQLWSMVNGAALASHFNGDTMLSWLLNAGAMPAEDPSPRVLEDVALLHAVALKTGHSLAIARAAAEARSFLFLLLSDPSGALFWHVPFPTHTMILSGILVPACLALSRVIPLPHEELATALSAALSAADTVVDAPKTVAAGLPFSNTAASPFPPFASDAERFAAAAGVPASEVPIHATPATARPRAPPPPAASSSWFGFGGKRAHIGISDPSVGKEAPKANPLRDMEGVGTDQSSGLSLEERAFQTLNAKMRSLAAQLCRGMPKPIALIIIGLLPTRVRSASVVSVLMEAAVQAYLTAAGMDAETAQRAQQGGALVLQDASSPSPAPRAPRAVGGSWASAYVEASFVKEPLAVLGAALASRPETSLPEMVQECMAQQAPLSLRLLLSLQLLRATSEDGRMSVAIQCVRYCASCRVNPAREFELLPLWFFVIELVMDASWQICAIDGEEAVTAFSRAVQTAAGMLSVKELVMQGSLWDSFGKEPPPPLQLPAMQLAARAVLLYLGHALDAKARDAVHGGIELSSRAASEEVRAQNGALIKCAQQKEFHVGFETFFASMQDLCNRAGAIPLAEFKKETVRTLLPMAPYLAGL